MKKVKMKTEEWRNEDKDENDERGKDEVKN